MLEGGIQLFAQRVACHVELDAARSVLHRGKAGLAHDALEHHAAGHAHGDGLCLQRLCVLRAVLDLQVCRMVLGFEVVGKSHAMALGLGFAQGAQFVAALGDELVFVLGCGGVVLFRHRSRRCGA